MNIEQIKMDIEEFNLACKRLGRLILRTHHKANSIKHLDDKIEIEVLRYEINPTKAGHAKIACLELQKEQLMRD